MANVQNTSKLTASQRALNFAQMTRQHWQALPSVTVNENNSITFTLPKVRLLSKIRLLVTGTITAAHAANVTYTPADFAPFNLIRNIRVEANNGFTPVNLSGQNLAILNMLRDSSDSLDVFTGTAALTAASRRRNKLGVESDAAGVVNPLRMVLDIPFTLNDRDPVGLILLQNEETVLTVTIDMADADSLVAAIAGYTITPSAMTITPMVETFSIPPINDAFPDLSILSIKAQKNEIISGAGLVQMALPVGMTYRKLAFYVTDAGGGVLDTALTGNFELVANQADVPYRVGPQMLSAINQEQYARVLPNGLWVFDFTYQGLANYGGTRDYVDTERLTEFWLRFNAAAAGNVMAVYECTSKLM